MVDAADWASAQWQRAHCVKNVGQLRDLMGDLLTEDFYADLERDQAERATMSMLVPPQMLNTMVSETTWADGSMPAAGAAFTEAFQLMSWMFLAALILVPFTRPAPNTAAAPPPEAH